jgi:hypothetical protein
MKIEKRDCSPERIANFRAELDALAEGCGQQTIPCTANCPKANPNTCSRYCPDVGEMLSSDPENYPIEPKIAPLVFELKSYSVFDPCWSCEGHAHTNGQLWKLPRVWFYADSLIHIRILGECLEDLFHKDIINARWRVALTFSDDNNADTTFCVEPITDDNPQPLEMLQKDVATIAERLTPLMKARTTRLKGAL